MPVWDFTSEFITVPWASHAYAPCCRCFWPPVEEARAKGYRSLRITTGAQNQAMRALARKFGADLTFRQGESTGSIDLAQQPQPQPALAAIAIPVEAARALARVNRAYWAMLLRLYGFGRTAA